jgi:hypothetical protein
MPPTGPLMRCASRPWRASAASTAAPSWSSRTTTRSPPQPRRMLPATMTAKHASASAERS